MLLLICLILTLNGSLGSKINVESEQKPSFKFVKFFDGVTSVIFLNLQNDDPKRSANHVSFIRHLMDNNIPCYGEWKNTTLQASEYLLPSEYLHEFAQLKSEFKYQRGINTGVVIVMSFPDPRKLLAGSLISAITERTIFLFQGYPPFYINDTTTVENIERELNSFFEFVWTFLTLPLAIGIVFSKTGEPIICTYDYEKWHVGVYGRGIRILEEDQFLNGSKSLPVQKLTKSYPLRIVFFERKPTSIKFVEPTLELFKKLANRTWGYGGLDGFIMGDTIDALGFNPIFKDLGPDEPYGYILSNGTVSGTLGEIVNMEADISFNARFIKTYGVEDCYHFLNYIHTDKLCLVMPKSGQIPLWHNVLRVYDMTIWTVVSSQMFVIGLLRWMQLKLTKQKKISLFRVMLDTYCLLLVPITGVITSHPRERLLLLLCLIINLVLVSLFQGNLHAAFSTSKTYPDIDTLEEIDQSGIVLIISRSFGDVFDLNEDFNSSSVFQRLHRKLNFDNNVGAELKRIAGGIWKAALVRSSDTNLALQTEYIGPSGLPLLHLIKECPRKFMLSYIVSNKFPFRDDMHTLMLRLVAAGLPQWYYEMTDYVLTVRSRAQRPTHGERYDKSLTLSEMSGAFMILLAGTAMATGLLVGEIVVVTMQKRKLQSGEHIQ